MAESVSSFNPSNFTIETRKPYRLASFREMFCYTEAIKNNIEFETLDIKNLNFVKSNLLGLVQSIKSVIRDLYTQKCIDKGEKILQVLGDIGKNGKIKKINFF